MDDEPEDATADLGTRTEKASGVESSDDMQNRSSSGRTPETMASTRTTTTAPHDERTATHDIRTATTVPNQTGTGHATRTRNVGGNEYVPQTERTGATTGTDEESDLKISEAEAKILPFVLALAGFFLTSGTDLRFGLLMGAMLMIVVVSGEFVVRLGREFLDNIEEQI
jgi:hypothetical protein